MRPETAGRERPVRRQRPAGPPGRGREPLERSTSLDRRAFLIGGAGALTAGLVLANAPVAWAAARPAAAPLSRSRFVPLVGRTFRVANSQTRLTLVEIDDLIGAPTGAEGQFALLFHGTGPGLASSLVSLTGQGPAVSLLVSPVDRGDVYESYQAVVNRPS